MCFAPIISLTTAIIEFVLASILLLFFPKSKLRNFFAVFIYVLGFYQFSEFMLCSGNAFFWAKIGFITYSFLPAIAIHAVSKLLNKKFNLIWVYIIPVLATIFAIATPGFILSASCEKYFVSVWTMVTPGLSSLQSLAYLVYFTYYSGFLLLTCFVILKDYFKQKNKIKREIELVELVGILLMVAPTLILILILPIFGIMFPSILCEFALFVAICAFIGAYLESKLKRKSKKSRKKHVN